LCLDFINTVFNRLADELKRDHVNTFADFVAWARVASMIKPSETGEYTATGKRMPTWADAVLQRARVLRETTYRAFCDTAIGRTPSRSDLEV
jgi:predicted RNA-binding Zn ribbon-like protein